MKAILRYLLGFGFLGKIGEYLNGKKTALGAILLVVHTLELVPQFIPECVICPEIAKGIRLVLEYAGISLVGIGLAHKAVK